MPSGYRKSDGLPISKGRVSPNKGKAMSDEQKEKIRKANTGKKMSEEARLKMIASKTGVPSPKKGIKTGPMSDEYKKKLSEVRKKQGIIPPSWKGRKRTPESVEKSASQKRGKARPDRIGEKNNLWRGGISSENIKVRGSLEYKIWRRSVFERDGYTCVHCGIKSTKGIKVFLHADHIKPFSIYPDLRFDINNGRTLCKECHTKTDTYGEKAKQLLKKHLSTIGG